DRERDHGRRYRRTRRGTVQRREGPRHEDRRDEGRNHGRTVRSDGAHSRDRSRRQRSGPPERRGQVSPARSTDGPGFRGNRYKPTAIDETFMPERWLRPADRGSVPWSRSYKFSSTRARRDPDPRYAQPSALS